MKAIDSLYTLKPVLIWIWSLVWNLEITIRMSHARVLCCVWTVFSVPSIRIHWIHRQSSVYCEMKVVTLVTCIRLLYCGSVSKAFFLKEFTYMKRVLPAYWFSRICYQCNLWKHIIIIKLWILPLPTHVLWGAQWAVHTYVLTYTYVCVYIIIISAWNEWVLCYHSCRILIRGESVWD